MGKKVAPDTITIREGAAEGRPPFIFIHMW